MAKRKRSDDEQSECSIQGITEPHENDVLSGRGDNINRHAGNQYFRNLVDKRKRVYWTSQFKREKRMIAATIVSMIKNLDPPGRFLAKDHDSGLWFEIGEERAHEKTSQALREKVRVNPDTKTDVRSAPPVHHGMKQWLPMAKMEGGAQQLQHFPPSATYDPTPYSYAYYYGYGSPAQAFAASSQHLPHYPPPPSYPIILQCPPPLFPPQHSAALFPPVITPPLPMYYNNGNQVNIYSQAQQSHSNASNLSTQTQTVASRNTDVDDSKTSCKLGGDSCKGDNSDHSSHSPTSLMQHDPSDSKSSHTTREQRIELIAPQVPPNSTGTYRLQPKYVDRNIDHTAQSLVSLRSSYGSGQLECDVGQDHSCQRSRNKTHHPQRKSDDGAGDRSLDQSTTSPIDLKSFTFSSRMSPTNITKPVSETNATVTRAKSQTNVSKVGSPTNVTQTVSPTNVSKSNAGSMEGVPYSPIRSNRSSSPMSSVQNTPPQLMPASVPIAASNCFSYFD